MMGELSGKRVAFLATDGFEDSELTSPWEAVTDAGAEAVLVAPSPGSLTGEHGHKAAVDLTLAEAQSADFAALVLPGGVVNADHLRMEDTAVEFVRGFFEQHKPVGVICHGGWILTDAEVVRGRTMTSYRSLRTDLRNAGAEWVDEEVVVDNGLVSSRTPADLSAFNDKLVEEFAEGRHARQVS